MAISPSEKTRSRKVKIMLEVMEDRHGKKSTILSSQLPVAAWYDIIGEPTLSDAILDRVTSKSIRIDLKGESLRKKK